MSHGFESDIAMAADDSLAPDRRRGLDAHLRACDACRTLLAEQRDARALLMARPIVAVRDLSAAIRATLEAEQPWIDRLNINWRVWSLRVAPVAGALSLVAVMLVSSIDGNSATAATSEAAVTNSADVATPVVSALWSEEVSDDALFTLFLRARPDDELTNYAADIQGAKKK